MSLLLQHGRHRGSATLSSPPEKPWHLDFFVEEDTGKIYVYLFGNQDDVLDKNGKPREDVDVSLGRRERFGSLGDP
jgi:hypothetical protein